jgi:hypothetical protein
MTNREQKLRERKAIVKSRLDFLKTKEILALEKELKELTKKSKNTYQAI